MAESVLLVLTVVACAGMLDRTVPVAWSRSLVLALCMWHLVAIPICIMYLIGHQVVMTLSPLFPSAESRTFVRSLRERMVLSDDELYSRYYEQSQIPKHIPIRVRHALLQIDPLMERVVPADRLYLFDEELDLADVLELTGTEFGLHFSRQELNEFDGTLDGLIQLVHSRTPAEHC